MSDKNNHDHSDELFQSHIGGAAMLEGVMMRGKYSWAVAVREPDGGIYLEEHDVPGYGKKQPWRKWPLIRGVVSLIESLVLQFKAMGITSAHAYDFDGDLDKDEQRKLESMTPEEQQAELARLAEQLEAEKATASKEASEEGMAPWMMVSMAVGVVLGVVLFVFAPAAVTNLIVGDYANGNMFVWNLVDGLLRCAIFVLYMWLIAFMPDIKRMYRYHGAEHQTIHCLEHGLPLVPSNCAGFSRQHVRCGTAFIIMTLLISIIVFTLFPTGYIIDGMGVTNPILRFLLVLCSRLILFPVVAGVAYEVTVRWAGSNPDNPLVKVLLAPGMAMQLLTTAVPDEGMLECAIAAMKAVIAREAREEGRELDADGLPIDRTTLAGCPLDTDASCK